MRDLFILTLIASVSLGYARDNVFYLNDTVNCCPEFPCGTCSNRYCCNDIFKFLKVASFCVDCTNYTDEVGQLYSNQSCTDSGQFCCGNCTSRYCCDDISLAFYQNKCPIPITTSTTTDYYWTKDYNYYYIPDLDAEYGSNVAIIVLMCTIIPILITLCVSVIFYAYKRGRDESQPTNMPIISNQVALTRSPATMGHIRDLLPPIPVHVVNNVNSNTILRSNTLPSYTEIKNESIVNGPFIIRTSDELPKYEEI